MSLLYETTIKPHNLFTECTASALFWTK